MEDLGKMKVAELKQALKDRGLPSSGTKPELVKRLGEALGAAVDSTDAGLEDSLQGIDDILNEDAAPPFPKKTSVAKATPSQPEEPPKVDTTSSKPEVPASNGVAATSVVPKPTEPPSDSEAKPVEISKMSESDRLKMRAEKYGIVSAEAKKELRAQRFGLPSSGGAISGELSSGKTSVDMDKLKKRAERFGTVVSTSLSKVEEEERKRKRAERFGGSGTVTTNVSSSLSSDDVEAKKRKRAERFGLAT